MSEQKLQKKILDWLKSHGCWVFKTITCNRSGIMDIIGCTPTGRFFGIEVKYGNNKASALQDYNIGEVKKRGGIAFVTWDLDTVKNHLRDEVQTGSKYLSKSQQTQQPQGSQPLL